MTDLTSFQHNNAYFDWQASIGEFGGWANQSKFLNYISTNSKVLDFGCGGGFLLNSIECGKKIGVEVNPSAVERVKKNGVEVFTSVDAVPDGYIDVVISATKG